MMPDSDEDLFGSRSMDAKSPAQALAQQSERMDAEGPKKRKEKTEKKKHKKWKRKRKRKGLTNSTLTLTVRTPTVTFTLTSPNVTLDTEKRMTEEKKRMEEKKIAPASIARAALSADQRGWVADLRLSVADSYLQETLEDCKLETKVVSVDPQNRNLAGPVRYVGKVGSG